MRNKFDSELELLNTELMEMALLVEEAIDNAACALVQQDRDLANKAISFEKEILEQERVVEKHCLKLLLHHQPVATDLRIISAALQIITNMERVGGIAVDICEIILRQIEAEYIKKPIHIPEMAQATIKMVKDSINAFVARDLALAQSVIEYDDIVDELFNTVKEELLSLIREKADNGEQAVDLLMIAKYFERVGDHAVSVSGWVVFSITSQYKNKRLF